ncbi:hypothetical protein LINGRAHAP2_LOCUS13933 [Linum grandiflorum]
MLQSITIPSIQGIHKTQTRRKPSYTWNLKKKLKFDDPSR